MYEVRWPTCVYFWFGLAALLCAAFLWPAEAAGLWQCGPDSPPLLGCTSREQEREECWGAKIQSYQHQLGDSDCVIGAAHYWLCDFRPQINHKLILEVMQDTLGNRVLLSHILEVISNNLLTVWSFKKWRAHLNLWVQDGAHYQIG